MLSKNQIKNITALHLKKHREHEKLFIVEGEKLTLELLHSSYKIKQIFALPEWIKKHETTAKGVPVIEINAKELEKISLLPSPNNVIAIAEQKLFDVDSFEFNNSLSIYLDDIRDPGNLGTIIRLAHWFGIKQLIFSPDTVECYNPKVIQSTMGSLFHVEFGTKNLSELIEFHKNRPKIYGAFLEGENIYTKKDFENGILVIGNESNGISNKNKKYIDTKLHIPRSKDSTAESLNAALATGIIVAEFFRRKNLS